jgi:hypothetical protein
MALARIITRSQACSRQLALDLLARGYAVEIVSPDNIPDNIADLELRVDTAPGDQLIASVEAHNGDRSASLDFVHHLKAPMVDLKPFTFPLSPSVSMLSRAAKSRISSYQHLLCSWCPKLFPQYPTPCPAPKLIQAKTKSI